MYGWKDLFGFFLFSFFLPHRSKEKKKERKKSSCDMGAAARLSLLRWVSPTSQDGLLLSDSVQLGPSSPVPHTHGDHPTTTTTTTTVRTGPRGSTSRVRIDIPARTLRTIQRDGDGDNVSILPHGAMQRKPPRPPPILAQAARLKTCGKPTSRRREKPHRYINLRAGKHIMPT